MYLKTFKKERAMGKSKIIIIVLLFLFSCKEEKVEFVQSRAIPALILIKNPPKSDSLLKTQLVNFLIKNQPKKRIHFYKYTWDTSYFIENKEDTDGGFSDNALYDYPEDDIATFFISKCEKDSTKLVGELYFYGNAGLEGSKREIDTLIYHCK